MNIHKTIVSNIRKLMNQRQITSYNELSLCTSISENTIKSWFAYNNAPKIASLDKLADLLNISTYLLFQEDPNFINKPTEIINSTKDNMRINLLQYLRATYGSSKPKDVLLYLDSVMSRDAYISYTRKSNNRSITINTLQLFCDKFDIKPYFLIKDGGITEWLNNQK